MEFTTIATLGVGFTLGVRHAADPDHLIAVSTLATMEDSFWSVTRLGVLWGLGHTTTLVVVSSILAGLGLVLARGAQTMFELPVALLLLSMGVVAIRRGKSRRGDGESDDRIEQGTNCFSGGPVRRKRASYLVGLVHGFAGSAALSLVAGAMVGSPGLAAAYALLVGLGPLVGMGIITLVLAIPAARWGNSDVVQRSFAFWAGILSVTWGLWMVTGVFV